MDSLAGRRLYLSDCAAPHPVNPLSYLFGIQYVEYTFSVCLIYALPSCVLLALYAMRIIRSVRDSNPSCTAFVDCTVFGVLFPGFIWPVLNGCLDISGVPIVALMLNIALHWDGGAFSWKHIFVLSALSSISLFIRRWYAYYIIGFYVSLAADLV